MFLIALYGKHVATYPRWLREMFIRKLFTSTCPRTTWRWQFLKTPLVLHLLIIAQRVASSFAANMVFNFLCCWHFVQCVNHDVFSDAWQALDSFYVWTVQWFNIGFRQFHFCLVSEHLFCLLFNFLSKLHIIVSQKLWHYIITVLSQSLHFPFQASFNYRTFLAFYQHNQQNSHGHP